MRVLIELDLWFEHSRDCLVLPFVVPRLDRSAIRTPSDKLMNCCWLLRPPSAGTGASQDGFRDG